MKGWLSRMKGWLRPEYVTASTNVVIAGVLIWTVGVAHCTLRQNARATKERYLTNSWNNLIKESIKYPEFNDESKTRVYKATFTGDRGRQYDSYARWVGSFLEDLYINKYNEEGWFYYEPTIKTYLHIHRTWLIDHIGYYEHTPTFRKKLLGMKPVAADAKPPPRQGTP